MNQQECKNFSARYMNYNAGTMNKRDATQDNLAKNLDHLMSAAGHNQTSLAELTKGKVSQRTISNIINSEKVARIDTVAILAAVYGIEGWHLLSPTLISDMKNSPAISALLGNYALATDEGKEMINQVAEQAGKFGRSKT